jgi:hypothetical protein
MGLMRAVTIGLALGLALVACSDDSGPSTDGTLVISTTTSGDEPDQDGYLITVDALDSLFLPATGTAERSLPAGRHTVQVLGVADRCSVSPGDSVELDLKSQDTASVEFTMRCPAAPPPPGFVRIITNTTGDAIPPAARNRVWAEHFGAWDYGGAWQSLGTLDANDTLVAAVTPSSESGSDPYWYLFHLDIAAPCDALEPTAVPPAPAFRISPDDTLEIEFDVTCDRARLAGAPPAPRFT